MLHTAQTVSKGINGLKPFSVVGFESTTLAMTLTESEAVTVGTAAAWLNTVRSPPPGAVYNAKSALWSEDVGGQVQ